MPLPRYGQVQNPVHNQEADSGNGSAEGRSSLPGYGVIPPSDVALYANGNAEGHSPLPGFGVSPKNSSSLLTPQAAKRIALYWHNGRSLGHTVRCATLGQ